MPISGAVLAGGESRRMGKDKALLAVGGVTLLQRSLDALAPHCDELLVVAREPEKYLAVTGTRARLVADLRRGGALAGIHAALSAAANQACLVVAVDMPLISSGLLAMLKEEVAAADAVVPYHDQRFEPLCAAYSKSCLAAIESQLDQGTDMAIVRFFGRVDLRRLDRRRIETVDPELSSFFNVNTPRDLLEVRRRMQGRGRSILP